MPSTNPSDNLGNIQKKSDHWAVAGTLAAILIVNFIGFLFPAYHASYSNFLFLSVLILTFGLYVWRAKVLWVATFETYDGSMVLWLILTTLAHLFWILFWGASVYTKELNGFK